MLYGARINGHNTLTLYGLCLGADLKIESPKLKSNYVDIPGADGSLNMSYSPQGYPVYADRTITFSLFKGITDTMLSTYRRALINTYQGREVELQFPHDNYAYTYKGVIEFGDIDGYNSGTIPVTVYAKPMRYKTYTQVVNGSTTITYEGTRPVKLYVDATASATVSAENSEYDVDKTMAARTSAGIPEFNAVPDFYIVEGTNTIGVTSTGTVTIKYTEEVL